MNSAPGLDGGIQRHTPYPQTFRLGQIITLDTQYQWPPPARRMNIETQVISKA